MDTDGPPFRYGARLASEIELCWQDRWEREGTFHAANPVGGALSDGTLSDGTLSAGFGAESGRPKFYLLDFFPYPSGIGLHVGHPLGYIGTDVFGRYLRMTGHHVLHPFGFDTFGLPAEQFAIETGQHPAVTVQQNAAVMRRQLRRLGLGHDRRREIMTSDPSYYRWTQWIFLRLFGSWYDPAADKARPVGDLIAEFASGRRATPDGRPWRDLAAAERADAVDARRLAYLSEQVVNWCPGLGTVLADEEVTEQGRSAVGNYPVYRRPLRQWMLRITAFAERLLAGLDEVDWPESVKRLQRNWIGPSGGPYHLKDWLFSRQRYWGEPFPIVYDEADPARPIALPDDMLPVTLPELTDFRPVPQDDASDPVPALARAPGWAEVTLDLGDGPRRYRRELNVMPQWAGSSWYYLRYLDPFNQTAPADPQIERYWMSPAGVDLYVGGVEHAVLHLLYARFSHMVLYDCGVTSTPEPFGKLFNQGYILADAFTDARGLYVREDFAALRFHTAIARIIELTAHAARLPRVPRALAEPLVLLVAPLALHIAEQLWQRLGHASCLAREPFPQADPALVATATVTLPVQVNGKVRFTIEVPASADRDDIADLLTAHPAYPRGDVARLVIVPGRIANIVLR